MIFFFFFGVGGLGRGGVKILFALLAPISERFEDRIETDACRRGASDADMQQQSVQQRGGKGSEGMEAQTFCAPSPAADGVSQAACPVLVGFLSLRLVSSWEENIVYTRQEETRRVQLALVSESNCDMLCSGLELEERALSLSIGLR